MRRVAAALAAAACAAAALAGCIASEGTEGGGQIVGETVTVYSLMPLSGARSQAAREIVDGQKLALAERGGRGGSRKVNFASLDLGPDADLERVADVARDAMHDPQVVAVIADLDNATARTTIPLFNAAGILHVSPGATYSGFLARGSDPTEPERWRPSGRTSFAPVPPSDAAQAVALADAARGRTTVEASADPDAEALAAAIRSQLERRDPRGSGETVIYAGTDPEDAIGVVGGLLDEQPRARILLPEALARTDLLLRRFAPEPRVRFMSSAPPRDDAFEDAFAEAYDRPPQTEYAKVGYDAMKGVLAALDRAGEDAGKRQSVIDAYFEADPLSRAAEQPFRLVRRSEAVF